jgi:hypothetical protein
MEKRLIDANALCKGLVSNHPVVIAAKCAPTIDAVPREEYKRLECELATMKAFMRYIAVELPSACKYCRHNVAGKVCEQECYGQGLEHFAFEWKGLPDDVFEKMEERR